MIAGLYGIMPTADGWIAIVGVAGAKQAVVLRRRSAGPT